jgi:hypothetical protein
MLLLLYHYANIRQLTYNGRIEVGHEHAQEQCEHCQPEAPASCLLAVICSSICLVLSWDIRSLCLMVFVQARRVFPILIQACSGLVEAHPWLQLVLCCRCCRLCCPQWKRVCSKVYSLQKVGQQPKNSRVIALIAACSDCLLPNSPMPLPSNRSGALLSNVDRPETY